MWVVSVRQSLHRSHAALHVIISRDLLLSCDGSLTAGPCRPRPREPSFQFSAYCVICSNLLPRPPYDVSATHCDYGSSEEDTEYVDSVEIAEYAVRRLPFLKARRSVTKLSATFKGAREAKGMKVFLGGAKGAKGGKETSASAQK